MECYFSTGAFTDLNLREIVHISLEHGINVELSSAVTYNSGMLEEVRQAKSRIRFLIHNYFPPPAEAFVLNLASDDLIIHEKSVEMCRRAIDLCVELGSPLYSIHAGFAFHITPDMLGDSIAQSKPNPALQIPREEAYERFVLTVRKLAQYAQANNIQLVIENNVACGKLLRRGGKTPLLLADVEEIFMFFSDINDPTVGLLLDTGHARVTATALAERPERFFEILAPYIRALHISDNDGIRDTHQRFNAKAWFAPFLKDYRKLPLVIESCRLTLEEILDQRHILAGMLS